MNTHRKMQKWERMTIKAATDRQPTRESRTTSHHPPKRGVGRPVKVLPLPEERTPGCNGCRGESHYHIQACRFHQPSLVAGREKSRAEEETAQKKQRIEEDQRDKAGRPGSSTDPDPDEPEKHGSTQRR